jgi:hypothetical protein
VDWLDWLEVQILYPEAKAVLQAAERKAREQ